MTSPPSLLRRSSYFQLRALFAAPLRALSPTATSHISAMHGINYLVPALERGPRMKVILEHRRTDNGFWKRRTSLAHRHSTADHSSPSYLHASLGECTVGEARPSVQSGAFCV